MRHVERSRTVSSLRIYLASVSAEAKAFALRQVRLDPDTNTLDFRGALSHGSLKPALYDRPLRGAGALQVVEHPLPMHALPVVQNLPTGSP